MVRVLCFKLEGPEFKSWPQFSCRFLNGQERWSKGSHDSIVWKMCHVYFLYVEASPISVSRVTRFFARQKALGNWQLGLDVSCITDIWKKNRVIYFKRQSNCVGRIRNKNILKTKTSKRRIGIKAFNNFVVCIEQSKLMFCWNNKIETYSVLVENQYDD